MKPVFTLAVPADTQLIFDGTADLFGSIYWAECALDTCDLVAITNAGLTRYRKTIFVEETGRQPRGSTALADDLLIHTLTPDRIEAQRTVDGEKVWSTDLGIELFPEGADAPVWIEEATPLVVQRGAALVAVNVMVSGRKYESWVVSVVSTSGQLRWKAGPYADIAGLVGDGAGNVFFAAQLKDGTPGDDTRLISLAADGSERWRVTTPLAPPLAETAGLLVQATGEVRRSDDGGVELRLRAALPLFGAPTPMLSADRLYATGYAVEDCDLGTCPQWDEPRMFAYDVETAKQLWAFEGDARMKAQSWERTDPVLTSIGSTIFATGGSCDAFDNQLFPEIDEDGKAINDCVMPSGTFFTGPASLTRAVSPGSEDEDIPGRWVSVDSCHNAVVGFDALDRNTAARGWVTARGNPGRSGKAR